jgi:septal ring factor EnvC (AmiA/AmiB activator)
MLNLNNIESSDLEKLKNYIASAKSELDKAMGQVDEILEQRNDLEYAMKCVSENEDAIAELKRDKENGEDVSDKEIADLEAELVSDKARVSRESERLAKLVEKQYIYSSLLEVANDATDASDYLDGKGALR